MSYISNYLTCTYIIIKNGLILATNVILFRTFGNVIFKIERHKLLSSLTFCPELIFISDIPTAKYSVCMMYIVHEF